MIDLQSHKPEFERFARKVLEILDKSESKNIVSRQPTILQDGMLSSISQDLMKKEPSYEDFASLLSDLHIIELYGTDSAEYLLSRFIYKLVVENRKLGFEWFRYDQSIFEKTFSSFISELLNPTWTYTGLCIVLNFNSNSQSILIDDSIKLEKFGASNITDFMAWNENQLQSYLERENEIIFRNPFLLMITEKIEKTPENRVLSNSPSAYSEMENLLTAFRLFKSGDISTGDFFYSRRSEFFNFIGLGYSWSQSTPFLHHFGQGYLLTKEELSDFNKFRIKLKDFFTKITNHNQILLSLRYFNSTYRSYDQPDDRLIDCVTSLEALFHIDSELAFKLSFRMAYLLSRSDEERKEIFSDIKKFYTTRNHIVHGSNLNEIDQKNIQNVGKLVDYVRLCLKAFIDLAIAGKLTTQFYEQIDIMLMNEKERADIQKIIF